MEQQHRTLTSTVNRLLNFSGLFFSRPRSEGWPHHGRTFSICPCRSGWLLHGKSCPRLDVVHPGRAWSSSPACTWHCSCGCRRLNWNGPNDLLCGCMVIGCWRIIAPFLVVSVLLRRRRRDAMQRRLIYRLSLIHI